MDIFESLENLNVSEECFDEIMGIVEEIIAETNDKKYREQTSKYIYDISRPDCYRERKNKKDDVNSPDLHDLVLKHSEKNKLPYEKHVELSNKAEQVKNKHEKNLSPEEKERAEKGRQELKDRNEGNSRVWWNNAYGDKHTGQHLLAQPDYQHIKKVARKALRGHTLDGAATEAEKLGFERKASYKRKVSHHTSPKFLYRVGKAILKHRNKESKGIEESLLLEELMSLLEDLRSSQRKHARSLYNRKLERFSKEEEIEDRKREEQEAEDEWNHHDYDDDDDYMDVISKKAPGVSYTSAEWHDNY